MRGVPGAVSQFEVRCRPGKVATAGATRPILSFYGEWAFMFTAKISVQLLFRTHASLRDPMHIMRAKQTHHFYRGCFHYPSSCHESC